jgi:hypothetical protein
MACGPETLAGSIGAKVDGEPTVRWTCSRACAEAFLIKLRDGQTGRVHDPNKDRENYLRSGFPIMAFVSVSIDFLPYINLFSCLGLQRRPNAASWSTSS